MTTKDEYQRYGAELIGTFTLVLIGCGSAVIAGEQIGLLGISLAFGLPVLAMVYAIGPISGCHINPAVTVAMLIKGNLNAREAMTYIVAQCIGAILAAWLLFAIASGQAGYSLTDPGPGNGLGQNGYASLSPGDYSVEACFIAEVVLTFLFLFVIFGAPSRRAQEGFAGLPIGFSLVVIHLIGIPITGTSVNPARSLGPAVLVGHDALLQLWLFWVAPIIGAVIAALVWKYIFEEEDEGAETEADDKDEDDD